MTGRADDRLPLDAPTDAVEAVLLDIDGTLLDSNDAHAQAWSDALREAGFEIGSETVLPLIGMGADKLLPTLTGVDAKREEGKRLIERRKEIFLKEYLPTVRPFPKAVSRRWRPSRGRDVGERRRAPPPSRNVRRGVADRRRDDVERREALEAGP